MKFIDRLKFVLSSKSSQARIALSFNQLGQAVHSPRNYLSFTKEGYEKNVTVYRCINMIAKACAGIEWELYSKRPGMDQEIENHPIIDLLKRPNPLQAQTAFFEAVVSYYALTGNTFIEASRLGNKPPLELWTMRPDLMALVPNDQGYPGKYIFKAGTIQKVFEVDPITMRANVLHVKSFNPTDIWWGMSPMAAAMMSLDQNNHASRWNLSLLQNSAVPSGVLQVLKSDTNVEGSLTEEQHARLLQELENAYMGSRNAGRPMLLEGGMEWKSISLSPKDMEFLENKNVTSIDICQAFGVPPEMLGLGQKTFNNYKEARKSFYQETVLPIMDILQSELNAWLIPMFDKNRSIKLCYDKDDIEALQTERAEKFQMANSANYLTQNEKRQAVGYEPAEGWDVFVINNQILSSPEDFFDVEAPPEEPEEPEVEEPSPGPEESVEVEDEEPNDSSKGWKSFNLLNNNEKQDSWRKQNWRRKRLESAMARDLESDFREMSKDVASALQKSKDPKVIEFAVTNAVSANIDSIEKTLKRHIKYSIQDFGQNTFNQAKSTFRNFETKAKKSEAQWEDWAKVYIDARSKDAMSQIEGTTKKQIKRIFERVEDAVIKGDDINEIASELGAEFSNIGKSRARLIARTEVASASNESSLEAVRSLGLPNMYKEWVSSQDDRTRDGGPDGNGPDHLNMNGVEIPMDEKFTVPPDTDMDGPGDMTGGAENVCNCRCVLVFKSKNVSDI